MKIFDRDEKINFVDENNTLVGFSNDSQCCEIFGWFFTDNIPTEIDIKSKNEITESILENYNFDTNFFQNRESTVFDDVDTQYVVFRVIHKTHKDILYLVLYNHQNGYYSHGFNMNVGGIEVRKGKI